MVQQRNKTDGRHRERAPTGMSEVQVENQLEGGVKRAHKTWR